MFILFKKKYDYITINYNIKENNEYIKIFGKDFVKNNKYNCHIIYENEHYKLSEYLELNKYENNKILEIKLIGFNNIIIASCMFYKCKSLISLPNISEWNINNVTNMSCIFYGCISLISLPDISKWNTNNVTDMSWMFCRCESLISLPDISKWNTNNVTNMDYLFNGCKSLKMVGNTNFSDFKIDWDMGYEIF